MLVNNVILSVTLDGRAEATAGSPLRGTVQIDAKTPFKASRVALRMYGKEKTNVSGKYDLVATSERRFFSTAMDLKGEGWGPGKKNPAGKYTLPFEIGLPASLPPSTSNLTSRFGKVTGNKEGFRVQYKLVASIPRKFKKFAFASVDTRSKTCPIDVFACPQSSEPHPCMIQPVTQDLKGIFKKKGSITFGASIDDSELSPGENLRLNLACRNNSTIDIKKVQIELVERLEWEAYFGENQAKHPLRRAAEFLQGVYNVCNSWFGEEKEEDRYEEYKEYQEARCDGKTFGQDASNVLFTAKDVDLPGLEQDKKSLDDVRESSEEKYSTYQKDCEAIYKHLKSGDNRFDIKLPLETRYDHHGRLISIEHYLKITLQTKMFVSDAELFVPILVAAPPELKAARNPSSRPVPAGKKAPQLDSASGAPDDSPCPTSPDPKADPASPSSESVEHRAPLARASEDLIFVGIEAENMVGQKPTEEWILPNEIIQAQRAPSMNNLWRYMQKSIDPSDLIARRAKDQAWAIFFGAIAPEDFGRIVSWVPSDFGRPRAAAALAPLLNGSRGMSCEYAAAAIRNTGSWNRATLVKKLLPLCFDLKANHELIRDELNEWEELVNGKDFERLRLLPKSEPYCAQALA